MLNPFFLNGSKTEQGLMQDLINESIKMYGIDVYYLPRQYITEKTIIKEVIESEFNSAYAIEAYLETYEGYSENPTILSKFGIQALNEITLSISTERFKNYITPLIENQPNIKLTSRPKEGDLIFFPLGKRLFEIKYVEHEKPFYQLQGSYTYQLRCELFRYEDEIINTSINDIDQLLGSNQDEENNLANEDLVNVGNITNLNMVGIGVTATAITSIANGGIRYITITNRGGGYTSVPNIGISSSPNTKGTASAIAQMIEGVVVCNKNINPKARSVQKALLINPGAGYTATPGVKISGGNGSGATAQATLANGVIGIITVTNPGSGYILPPSITFSGISSVSAAATAILTEGGSIDSILISDAGSGYLQIPTITIGNPNLTSQGSFIFNEIVTGTISGVTARVKSWNSVTNVLQVYKITGNFILGENIVGTSSSASHYLRTIELPLAKDGYNDNDIIEDEADEIVDFDESNPFGMP